MTVGKLMETYEGCIAKLRKSQSSRRRISLKKVAEANFTKTVSMEGDEMPVMWIFYSFFFYPLALKIIMTYLNLFSFVSEPGNKYTWEPGILKDTIL